jgi:AcrR family transcriptional regulator
MVKPRRFEQSQRTRSKLMTAARDLVVTEGWAAASSRAIAHRAGVNQALINFHFKGKAGLFRATLDRCVENIEKDFGPWMAVDSLSAYINKGVESIPRVRRNKNFKFLLAAMLEGAQDASMKTAVINQMNVFRAGLRTFLERHGLAEEDLDRYTAMMAAAMDGLLLHYILDPSTDASGAIRAYEEMLEASVRDRG